MSGRLRWSLLFGIVIQLNIAQTEDASCLRIDFDQATLTYLARCSFYQEFVSKPYTDSVNFNPFRKDAKYYLSNKWEGLTCGETVESFSLNEETELRMVYNLIFDYGAALEVRVIDLDRLDGDNRPTVVIRWKTEQATTGWGLFREKMDKTVKRAKIQIEANMNAKSDVAIEYFTVFNFEVESDECQSVDEFAPTTTTQTPTSTTTSSTVSSTTSTTTSTEASTSSTTESSTTAMTTDYSPRDESTSTTTELPTPEVSLSTSSTEGSSTATPNPEITPISNEWIWITLSAVFAILFCLAVAGSAYIYAINKHLLKLNVKLRDNRHNQCQSDVSHNSSKREKRGVQTYQDV